MAFIATLSFPPQARASTASFRRSSWKLNLELYSSLALGLLELPSQNNAGWVACITEM